MTTASWQPDPTGRNQFRWWDGAAWSDHVSNQGVAATDPLQPAPVAPQQPAAAPSGFGQAPLGADPYGQAPLGQAPLGQAPYGQAPLGADPFGQPPVASGGSSSPLKFIVPIVVVVALAVVLFLVLGGDDDGGGSGDFGVSEVELTEPDQIHTMSFSLRAGQAVRIRIEADNSSDLRAGIATDRDTADAYFQAIVDLDGNEDFTDFVSDADDFYTDADAVFSEGDTSDVPPVMLSDDDGDEGEPLASSFIALVDGSYTLVIGSSDDDDEIGNMRIIVERYTGTIDGDVITDLDEINDLFSDDDFVTDDTFFSDEEPFTP